MKIYLIEYAEETYAESDCVDMRLIYAENEEDAISKLKEMLKKQNIKVAWASNKTIE